MSFSKQFFAAATLMSLLSSVAVAGATFYRYTDENGTVVMDSSIPPEYVRGGYTVLDENGVVIRVVEPALSDEEQALKKASERAAELQAARDKELLRLYRNGKDVDRAMNTWMERLDVEISLIRNQHSVKKADLTDLQVEAANLERAGKDVPADLLDAMAAIQVELDGYISDIEDIEKRKESDRGMFERDRVRVQQLVDEKFGNRN